MLKISAVYLIGKAEIPIHYTTWATLAEVEQAFLMITLVYSERVGVRNNLLRSVYLICSCVRGS